jgi:hypothetical protein
MNFVRTAKGTYLNLAQVISITPDHGTPAPENWQVRTTIHEPGHITEHYQIGPDDLTFALGRLIPARTDAGFAHLLSYSRVVGDVEITRSPIIAWWFPPDGSVWPLPVTPDFTVLDRDDFTVVHRDDFTVSDKTFRWVLTEEPNGGFKGSNGGFYNSVDEAKAELLAVGLRNDPPR